MNTDKFVYWVSGIYLTIIAGFVAWSLLAPAFENDRDQTPATPSNATAALADPATPHP